MNRLSLTVFALLTAAPVLAAQTAPNACGLLTKAEVDKLINRGKTVSGDPTVISSAAGKGSVCDYPAMAQVGIYVGPNSHSHFEWIPKAYQITEKDKKPVTGIGDKAYRFSVQSKNPVDHGTTLVMTVGEYTVTAQIAAHVGEADGFKASYCKFPADLTPAQKADCDKAMADKTELPEAVWPAVQELGKVLVAKVRK